MHPEPGAGAAAWWKHPSSLLLLAVNLIPLAGVLFLQWSLFAVMALFWFDNVLIGLFAYARASLAQLEKDGAKTRRPTPEWRASQAGFGAFVYGFFTLVHGALVFGIFGMREIQSYDKILFQPELAVAAFALAVTRAMEYYLDYLRPRAYETAYVSMEAGKPFERIFLLHAVILIGGTAIALTKAPVAALVVLVALKAWGDIAAARSGRR